MMFRKYENKATKGIDPLAVPTDMWIRVKTVSGNETHAKRLPAGTLHNLEPLEKECIAIRSGDGMRIVSLAIFGKLYRKG